jgi:hypothetical protein
MIQQKGKKREVVRKKKSLFDPRFVCLSLNKVSRFHETTL